MTTLPQPTEPWGIQPGDVLMFSGRKLFSWVIRIRAWLLGMGANSKWSHCGIAVRMVTEFDRVALTCPLWVDLDDEQSGDAEARQPVRTLCVVESYEGQGVRVVPFTEWLKWSGEIRVLKHDLTAAKREKMISFALRHWGNPYSSFFQFANSFGAITRRLRRAVGWNADIESNRFFCSELVAAALHAAGIKLPQPAATMTPGDVAEFLAPRCPPW
jgi:hypothetical protein